MSMNQQDLNQLIDRQKKGYALENDFYAGPDIYQRDIERIFMRVWLYTGHQSEIPNPGDFFLYEMAGESVIISHGVDGEIRAMMNVCRHRGSHVCWEKQGNSKRFTCPYHGWTYGTDGQLVAAAHMHEGFDKSTHGLKQIHIKVFFGMIFINFAAEPSSFDVIENDLAPFLKPFRLDQAKVAHRQSYPMKSNWKLAVENYKECYHCAPAHMEYARAHSLALPQEKWQAELDAMIARMPSCGLTYGEMNHSYTQGAEFGADRAFEHYPLLRGHVTGSKDGNPLAPLLGDITGFDGGAHDFKIGPVLYGLAYCDHVMLYSFKPISEEYADCDITWLVRGDAVEGKDYNKADLIWLWDVTTHADKSIIEHNQAGVRSRMFEPGPFSTFEGATQRWVEWYLASIR